jgi:hypothetical protein
MFLSDVPILHDRAFFTQLLADAGELGTPDAHRYAEPVDGSQREVER